MDVKDIISSGVLESYVMGHASVEETEQVNAWAQQFPEIREELLAIEESLMVYANQHAVKPAPGLKGKIFSEINTTRPAQPAKILQFGWRWASAASVILLVGSAVLNIVLLNKYDKVKLENKQAQDQLALVKAENDNMKTDMNIINNDMAVIHSKYSEPLALKGLEAAPDAAAKIFWMKNTGEVYIDPSNLPAPPQGMQYQLWAIVDGKPVDGGMINKQPGKIRIQKMKSFGKAEAFAVTLETEGGHPQPKGQMYVMGKL
jgi:anti-sigma-K factor RskA